MDDTPIEIARMMKRYIPSTMMCMATNSLEPDKYLQRILQIRRFVPLAVLISLNGPKVIDDMTRGLNGHWEKALKLSNLLRENAIPFHLLQTLTPETENYQAYIQDLARSFGVRALSAPANSGSRFNTEMKNKKKYRFDCICPDYYFTVWPNGDVKACEEDIEELKIGNLYQKGLDDMDKDFERVRQFVKDKKCQPCSQECFYSESIGYQDA